MEKPYQVITGCYGGRRGTLVGTLTQTLLDAEAERRCDLIRVCILPRGLRTFMKEDRLGVPIPTKFIDALENIIQDEALLRTVPLLRTQPRVAATQEELQRVQVMYAADTDAASFYFGLSQGLEKYTPLPAQNKFVTMLQGAGMSHVRYGYDLDDVESPIAYVLEEIVRPNLEKRPKPGKQPADYPYHNLAGDSFAINDPTALTAEAQDLVRVSQALAQRILCNALIPS